MYQMKILCLKCLMQQNSLIKYKHIWCKNCEEDAWILENNNFLTIFCCFKNVSGIMNDNINNSNNSNDTGLMCIQIQTAWYMLYQGHISHFNTFIWYPLGVIMRLNGLTQYSPCTNLPIAECPFINDSYASIGSVWSCAL